MDDCDLIDCQLRPNNIQLAIRLQLLEAAAFGKHVTECLYPGNPGGKCGPGDRVCRTPTAAALRRREEPLECWGIPNTRRVGTRSRGARCLESAAAWGPVGSIYAGRGTATGSIPQCWIDPVDIRHAGVIIGV